MSLTIVSAALINSYRLKEIARVLAFESICENAPKLGSHSLAGEEGSSRAQTAGQENPF